jgi:hypothetical protein
MHYAWWAALRAYSAWASAKNKALDAAMPGATPPSAYADNLLKEYHEAWIKAQDEEKRFVKQLKLSANDISKITNQARTAASADPWVSASSPTGSFPTETPETLSGSEHDAMQAIHQIYMATELPTSIKRRYNAEDYKWLVEFLRLYDQAQINDITRLDSGNMPADHTAALIGATTLPPILDAVKELPKPKDRQLRALKRAFEDTLWAAIIASEDVRELADSPQNRVPVARIAFDATCAADMNEQLSQKLGKVLGE